MRRILHVLNGVLLLLLVGGSVWMYGQLPDQVPAHFNASGAADRWVETSAGSWFLIALIGVGLAVSLYGLAWWIGQRQGQVNMVNQRTYDALSEAGQAKVKAVLVDFMYVLCAMVLLLLGALQSGAFQVAMGFSEQLPTSITVILWVVVGLSLLSAPLLVWQVQAKIDKLHNNEKTDG